MNMERMDRLARHQLGAPVIKSKAEPISDIRLTHPAIFMIEFAQTGSNSASSRFAHWARVLAVAEGGSPSTAAVQGLHSTLRSRFAIRFRDLPQCLRRPT
jgi:hypothetical protein